MNPFWRGIAVFIGVFGGYYFLNEACVTGGSFTTKRELAHLIVTVLTIWSSVSLCLKLVRYLTMKNHKNSEARK
ncbi:hypothetical protein ED28_02365 [[Pantoea] beijingensis]|uniref:Uncharacterized protein n=1 Tax=[Pantoea] beijingensis TaxID=1324864 RepID=A0A443II74_9GAMM|nr:MULTISPECIES: hypothetical protein [Erwiniaceae]RWR03854.1 hypothetical protein ED28_02365 [[Pantoea] beijingensis]